MLRAEWNHLVKGTYLLGHIPRGLYVCPCIRKVELGGSLPVAWGCVYSTKHVRVEESDLVNDIDRIDRQLYVGWWKIDIIGRWDSVWLVCLMVYYELAIANVIKRLSTDWLEATMLHGRRSAAALPYTSMFIEGLALSAHISPLVFFMVQMLVL